MDMPGPAPQIPTEDVLQLFIATSDPAFVSSEIASAFDVTRQTARNRLNALVEDGLLASKRAGQQTKLYWLTDAGRQRYFELSTDAGRYSAGDGND